MEHKKKNSFFTFIFSLLPGAAEMYMGFMKCGLSLLGVFALSVLFPSLLHASDVWIFLPMVVYVYGFFHARNMASMSPDKFEQTADHWIWNEFTDGGSTLIPAEKMRRYAAVLLIILGVLALWNCFRSVVFDMLPRHILDLLYPVFNMLPSVVFAVIIIIVGVKLISGKKAELKEAEYE